MSDIPGPRSILPEPVVPTVELPSVLCFVSSIMIRFVASFAIDEEGVRVCAVTVWVVEACALLKGFLMGSLGAWFTVGRCVFLTGVAVLGWSLVCSRDPGW